MPLRRRIIWYAACGRTGCLRTKDYVRRSAPGELVDQRDAGPFRRRRWTFGPLPANSYGAAPAGQSKQRRWPRRRRPIPPALLQLGGLSDCRLESAEPPERLPQRSPLRHRQPPHVRPPHVEAQHSRQAGGPPLIGGGARWVGTQQVVVARAVPCDGDGPGRELPSDHRHHHVAEGERHPLHAGGPERPDEFEYAGAGQFPGGDLFVQVTLYQAMGRCTTTAWHPDRLTAPGYPPIGDKEECCERSPARPHRVPYRLDRPRPLRLR